MEIQGRIKQIFPYQIIGQNGFEKRDYKCKLALKLGFNYDEIKGVVISPTGKIVTKTTKSGYICLTLRDNSKTYYLFAHQFAWFVINKECVNMIDHIDGNKTNNKISNLRAVNKSINGLNRKSKGVYFCKRANKFIANITDNYKHIHIGSFNSYEEAEREYLKYKEKLIQWKLQEL